MLACLMPAVGSRLAAAYSGAYVFTTTTTTATSAGTTGTTFDASSLREVDTPSWWPTEWGTVQWTAILTPVAVMWLICCYLYGRRRYRFCSRERRAVKVAPMPAEAGGGPGASLCDFSRLGPLSVKQLQATEGVLVDAERESRITNKPMPKFVLAFSAENELGAEHLEKARALLERHSSTYLQFDADWSQADDASLMALAPLLTRYRDGRCRFGAPNVLGARSAVSALRLPARAKPAALEAVAEALAVGNRAEVDAIVLDQGRKSKGDEEVELALGALRLSCQELTLSKRALGDAGCVAACAFVRPWVARLHVARLMQCELEDVGAIAVARLLQGPPGPGGPGAAPAANLRELTLTANAIGDKGVLALAEAMPRCDSLERLLLDRNQIGHAGARALATRLPRSSLKELVLGSHLGGNPLGPAGAEALALALDDELPRAAANRPHRLGALALEECGVGEHGAKAFARALPRSALFALSLARGQVGSEGAKAILASLPPSMVSLDLAGNGITDSAASAAGDALYRTPTLMVSLAQNGVTPSLAALLREEHGARMRV